MENKDLQIVKESANKKYIIVSREYCENVIQKLCVVAFSSSLIPESYNKEENNYRLSYTTLACILLDMEFKFDSTAWHKKFVNEDREAIVEQYSYLLPFYYKRKEIEKKCLELKERFKSVYSFLDYLFTDEQLMLDNFGLLCKLVQIDYDFYYLVDLIAAKEDIIVNLKYICDEEKVAEYKKQYTLAIETLDRVKLKKLLENTQALILKHWKEYLTDVDEYKPGEPFKFLCHSSVGTFDGDFHSGIISMSLLTEQLYDVFNEEFGFIFDSSNIIAADSQDMCVNNYSETDDNVLYYSTIKKISAPERLVDDCLKLKSKNVANNSPRKVYSEVAKRGFNPKAIFCLTDGSKTFNYNYENALELQRKFPELKVIEIDKTLYNLRDEELRSIKINLIWKLKCCIHEIEDLEEVNSFLLTDETSDLVRAGAYDNFWSEFMELKKKEIYTEDDILALFKKYEILITNDNDIRDLFDRNYTKDELTYFLKYNIWYGVRAILFGKRKSYFANIPINFELSELNKVYDNLNIFAGDKRLDEFVPGLSTFLQLYGFILKIDLCDSAKLRVCSCNNFVDINLILISYLRKEELEQLPFVNLKNDNLGNQEYLDVVASYAPRILKVESKINEQVKVIMDYLKSKVFLLSLGSTYVSRQKVETIVKDLRLCDEKLQGINNKKNQTIYANKVIDEELKELLKHALSNFKKVQMLYKERLGKVVSFKSLIAQESEEKKKRLDLEQQLSVAKELFKSETGFDYDEYMAMIVEAKNLKEYGEFKGIGSKGACIIFGAKVVLEIELEELLSKLNMTIGQFHDYIDNYYNNGPSGLAM